MYVCVYIYVRCSLFTVRNFILALSDDIVYGLPVPWSVPKWLGFMGNPDHPSSLYIPDDQGTAMLSSPMLFSLLCSYSWLSIWSH